jgi:hypothetical protein
MPKMQDDYPISTYTTSGFSLYEGKFKVFKGATVLFFQIPLGAPEIFQAS